MRKNTVLLDLPTELIQQVLSKLQTLDLLGAISTCHKIKAIAEPLLYKSITIRSPKSAQLLIQTLLEDPQRTSWILSYTLEIVEEDESRYQELCGEDIEIDEDIQGDEDARILGLMPRLEHFRIKSPWPSYHQLPLLFDARNSLQESHISSHLKTGK